MRNKVARLITPPEEKVSTSDNPNIEPLLSISTFAEGMGGIHYYARLYVAQDEHGRKLSWDAHRRIDQEEADFLNMKDGGTSHRKGELTHRFNSEEAAREASLELARRIWGPGQQVHIGEEYLPPEETVTLD